MWVYFLISVISINLGTCYFYQPSIYYQQSLYYPPAYKPNYVNYNYRCCWYPPMMYNRYHVPQFPYWPSYQQRYMYPVYQSALYVPSYGGFPTTKRPVLAATTLRPLLAPTASRPVLTSTTSRPIYITEPIPSPTPRIHFPTATPSPLPTFIPTSTSTPTSSNIPNEVTTEKEEDDDNGSGGFSIDDEDFA